LTLRWRISAAFAAGAAATALVLGVLVYERTAADSASHARSLQTQRARIAASLFNSTGRLAFSATVNDPGAPGPLRYAADHGEVASFLRTASGGPAVWAAAPLKHRGGAVFVRASFAPSEVALASLRRSLIEIGALVTLGMALLGLLFAGRLSARLRAAARVATRIGEGDPQARIGMGGRDEVAALAGAVDRMADSLHRRIERERRFSGDVAHELRTPISGLIAAAALLDDGEPARMVRGRARRLAQLTEDLLEISRLEAGAERALAQRVDLLALVKSVCGERSAEISVEVGSQRADRMAGADAGEAAGQDGPQAAGPAVEALTEPAVEALTEPAVEAFTDPRRLARILANLVDNALRHGRLPIVVEVSQARIRVIDSGPGFTADMLAHATERFSTGSSARGQGTGLGLAIAAAQAEVIGARLTLDNRAERGAIATVTLPADDRDSAVASST